jgi:6-phosphogluconolactonase
MSVHRFKYPDPPAAAAACAHNILAELETVIAGGVHASLAISGGTTPALMFREMAKQSFRWDRVHLFWVDERAVPPSDSQSNYKLADENFITPANFPRGNVHRVPAERGPQEAVRLYIDDIRDFFGSRESEIPRFDVIHRGVGPDAHTASLFPGEPLIDDREGIAAAVWVEKMSQRRITLLPAVLLAARHTVVLAAGEDKAVAVRQIFSEPYEPKKCPSQLGLNGAGNLTWFLDEAAAKLIDCGTGLCS